MAAAIVYLAGIVGGGLHHHTHHAPHASDRGSGPLAWSDNSADRSAADDSYTCTLCAAIHQAKAPPPALVVVASTAVADQAVTDTTCQPPILFQATAHARAPPIL